MLLAIDGIHQTWQFVTLLTGGGICRMIWIRDILGSGWHSSDFAVCDAIVRRWHLSDVAVREVTSSRWHLLNEPWSVVGAGDGRATRCNVSRS